MLVALLAVGLGVHPGWLGRATQLTSLLLPGDPVALRVSIVNNAAADGLRLVLVAAGDDVTEFWRGIGFRPPVAARVPSQWIETLQRRFTESTVLCYALDGEAGGADACERAVQASIERMGHREAGRAAKRHRR